MIYRTEAGILLSKICLRAVNLESSHVLMNNFFVLNKKVDSERN